MSVFDGVRFFIGKTIAEILVALVVVALFVFVIWLGERK